MAGSWEGNQGILYPEYSHDTQAKPSFPLRNFQFESREAIYIF